jgi:hypothetical protein
MRPWGAGYQQLNDDADRRKGVGFCFEGAAAQYT